MEDFYKLQNGSDIRGIALEGVAGEEINLGKSQIEKIMDGFVFWLRENTGKKGGDLKISLGHDSRLSASFFMETAIKRLTKRGVRVLDCGLASTPAMFMSTVFSEYSCDGAIMITASHLPFNRNGFKFFSREGGLDKKDIKWILEKGFSSKKDERLEVETFSEKVALMDRYAQFLKEKIKEEVNAENYEKPLAGLKIVVDAGNGAGGFYAKDVLKPLGADIKGSQFLEPDGKFPNHQPNPENKEAMESICKKVTEVGADLGLIFDTDVDRSSAVDSKGREINRDKIVAMAAALIAKDYPGTTVVTDSVTGENLTAYLEQCLGLKHLRYKRGYKNVINKAISLNKEGIDSQLAIETSGHGAYKENYFLDDGAYLATKIVIKTAQLKAKGETIDVVLSSLKEAKDSCEVRFPIEGSDFADLGDKILSQLEYWAGSQGKSGIQVVKPNYEGVRLNFKREGLQGWCLLRKSLHDPILPLNIQVSEGSCEEILAVIKDFLSQYENIRLIS